MAIGKWILAGLGWAVGGPIGALIGFFIGKAFDGGGRPQIESGSAPRQQRRHHGPYRNTGGENDLMVAFLVLIADVMSADNVRRKSELDYVKRFLLKNYGEQKAKELLLLLRDIMDKPIDIRSVCAQIKVNTNYTTRYHMIDFLFGLAMADMELSNSELDELEIIRSGLGINLSDYISIKERYTGRESSSRHNTTASGKDPYKVLGLNSSATDDEVRKAYRRFAMKYHPDKVEHLGDEMRKNAEAQFREINEAYERIKEARGIK